MELKKRKSNKNITDYETKYRAVTPLAMNLSTGVNINNISSFENTLLHRSPFNEKRRRAVHSRISKGWFDIDCNTLKKEAKQMLNKFRIARSVYDFNKYILVVKGSIKISVNFIKEKLFTIRHL